MKIQITLEIDDEIVDESDDTGLTSEGFDFVMNLLGEIGWDIDIKRKDI